MIYKRNTLIIMYLILSCFVLMAHLKKEKKRTKQSQEEKETKEENDSKEEKEEKVKKEKIKDKAEKKKSKEEKNREKEDESDDKNDSKQSGENTDITNLTTTTTEDPATELRNQDWDVWCKLQPNGNDCSGRDYKISRFYYDTLLEDCKTFQYGRCKNIFNNFDSISECRESCREAGVKQMKKANYTDKILCRLQPSFGTGFEYHPMFFYDINDRKCKGFSFSGRGGNGNRFVSNHECATTCIKLMEAELSSI